jgi:hypothetical protein
MCPYSDEYLQILSAAVCIVKMVNWHDPTVLEEDNCKFLNQLINTVPS